MSALILLILLAFSTRVSAGEIERIWVESEVNGKPVHLAFDTGFFTSVLTRQTLLRLGLKLMTPETSGFLVVPGGTHELDWTEECRLTAGSIEGPVTFGVLDPPAWAEPVGATVSARIRHR